jgi:uncharacterized membrane protein
MMPSTMPMTDSPPLTRVDPLVAMTRWLAVGSTLALIVLGLVWELWLAPLRPGGSLAALKVVPLCIPLSGFLRNRMYTYRWMSLFVWLYFTEGVVLATSDHGLRALFASMEIILCLALFAACVLHVRLRQQRAKS